MRPRLDGWGQRRRRMWPWTKAGMLTTAGTGGDGDDDGVCSSGAGRRGRMGVREERDGGSYVWQKKRREHAAVEAFGLGAVLGGEDGNVELDAWPCLGATAASSWKTDVDAGGVAGRPRHPARVGWPVPAACVDTHLWCRLPRALIGWPYRPRHVAAEWEDYSSRRENDLGFVLNIYMHP
uniref:Uncharacterized protein n=1 Tax=Oryza rufipogon TaxID=4529 RepID=A0A0E0QP39_ORYRU